jgi:alkylation response protein AidB-like acyl-CoA dehydrogenase
MDTLEQFREDTRQWLLANAPPSMFTPVRTVDDLCWGGRKSTYPADVKRWLDVMAERGWTAPTWPKPYGGAGLGKAEAKILSQEMAKLKLRAPLVGFGLTMIGPLLLQEGSEELKRLHLPPIARGEIRWCQGYSEPGSGSDLASLQTRAVLDGDDFLVSGQKVWTSYADKADWMFLLVRTDPAAKKQLGISYLMLDMKTPGITTRPIVTIDGGKEVNEVFFDNVKLPVANLVGELNRGWDCAKYLLGNERTGIARVGASKRELKKLKDIAATEREGGQPLVASPRFRDKIASLEIELMALEITNLRMIAGMRDGKGPGPESSILKIRGSEIQQRLTELAMEAIGPYAMPFLREAMEAGWNEEPIGPDYAAPIAPHYFNYRKASIYGGSNEIQKNVISKMMLGL